MSFSYFYVDKTSDTAADTLLAVGFCDLLKRVLYDNRKAKTGIILADRGPYYEIRLPVPLHEQDIQQFKSAAILLPLMTKTTQQKGIQDGFDYEMWQEIESTFYEKLKRLPVEMRTPEARLKKSQYPLLAEIPEPAPELPHYQAINRMKIASSFNELAVRWEKLGTLQREHIRLLCHLFRQPGNDLQAAIDAWQKLAKEHQLQGKALVTQLQILNPVAGKGANRPKPSTVAPEGNPDNFWLLEMLKFVGFMQVAAPYVVQGSKDRKTYVLLPKEIELSTLESMMRLFRRVCWSSTAIKMDVLAALRFVQVFLNLREQALKGEQEEDAFSEADQLYSTAQGFEVTSHKDMGSAYATMNVATINLPWWILQTGTVDEVEAAARLLQEHLIIIQQLRNSKGEEGAEEYELLRFYRDFLSGRELRPFWSFTTAFSAYLMSQREREKDPRRQIRAFTTDGLEMLLTMSGEKKLTKITQNPGFRRIAYAIRQSTVRAQYRRSQLRDRTYEVRYGLGQELEREARYKEKFIVGLSRFLREYDAETAREEEKVANKLGRKLTSADRRANTLRGSVAESDLDEVIALIDEFGSEVVCHLLTAYGYASDIPRSTGDGNSRQTDVNGDVMNTVEE